MRELTVREFRSEWTKLSREVVRVSSRGRLLGHWVPGDSSLHWDDPDGDEGAQQPLSAPRKSNRPDVDPRVDYEPMDKPKLKSLVSGSTVFDALPEMPGPKEFGEFRPVPKPSSSKRK